jgi:hypothetical protein
MDITYIFLDVLEDNVQPHVELGFLPELTNKIIVANCTI